MTTEIFKTMPSEIRPKTVIASLRTALTKLQEEGKVNGVKTNSTKYFQNLM